jgi:cell wall-associated NlpC family hydrolase
MTTNTWPTIKHGDRRINVPESLQGQGRAGRVVAVFADLKSEPDDAARLDTQILRGETVAIHGTDQDWTMVRSKRDNYVGWTKTKNIALASLSPDASGPTHRVTAPRTFLYPSPDMKSPRSGYCSMGSLVTVVEEVEVRGTRYGVLDDGTAIIRRHLGTLEQNASDFVTVAELLLHTPYLWGGNTAFGIDCSGLVQLALYMSGVKVMRDSDMQAATIGQPVQVGEDWQKLKRGDLVFWRGHVAIAQGDLGGVPHLIHANGYTMDVTSEPALQAVERIAGLWQMPIGVRRI